VLKFRRNDEIEGQRSSLALHGGQRSVIEVGGEIDEIFIETDFEDAAHDIRAAAFTHATTRFKAGGTHFAFRPRQNLVGNPLAVETAEVLIRLVG
jgi:hypothetical protein